jgi:hypothetical protein
MAPSANGTLIEQNDVPQLVVSAPETPSPLLKIEQKPVGSQATLLRKPWGMLASPVNEVTVAVVPEIATVRTVPVSPPAGCSPTAMHIDAIGQEMASIWLLIPVDTVEADHVPPESVRSSASPE